MTKEEDITAFLTQIFLLTGREDFQVKIEKGFPNESQLNSIQAIYPLLVEKYEGDEYGKYDLLNRILLTIGIKPASPDFFKIIFQGIDFSDTEQIKLAVEKFRQICMLDYGNFRYGYKVLKDNVPLLQRKWTKYFPDNNGIKSAEKNYLARPRPVGLIPVDPDRLFSLGHLAVDEAIKINKNRQQLKKFLQHALNNKCQDISSVLSLAKKRGINLQDLVGKVAIPEAENLCPEKITDFSSNYRNIMNKVLSKCAIVEDKQIMEIQRKGKLNADTYLAMHDLDVYVATSMRDSRELITNWKFVNSLFHDQLAEWHIRYFDPTQKFLGDRIQEGLMECLMIMRAKVTIYNAQETDTFGKDAELGVTLAQGKPAIVYVARLFENNQKMKILYDLIDKGSEQTAKQLASSIIESDLFNSTQKEQFPDYIATKNTIIDYLIGTVGREYIEELDEYVISSELMRNGNEIPDKHNDLIDALIKLISRLEKRALVFREFHPLSLQTSPTDGVARGVMVTRDIETTAEVLKSILTNNIKYKIKLDDKGNWILRDERTGSPLRVVANNIILTTAFWSEVEKKLALKEIET